jgi:hypothetical protein
MKESLLLADPSTGRIWPLPATSTSALCHHNLKLHQNDLTLQIEITAPRLFKTNSLNLSVHSGEMYPLSGSEIVPGHTGILWI